MIDLPIDTHLDRIVALVRERRAVVVTAAPGAGKTTRVPPALVADGPVILLQPRRIAARAIARRIAAERGWTVGREVGWQVRFDRSFSTDTRLLVVTEGILTARLQQDRRLTGFRTIVVDEFHERSLHADLGLALARQAWRERKDLRLVVMSATIDATRVAAFLDRCPIVDVPGVAYPVEIGYRPGITPERAIADALPSLEGALLCFLPGAPEIRRTGDRLGSIVGSSGAPVLPLHGSLDADEQDAALRPGEGRRVILATNLAETTLTVPDVTCVIDTGLQKVARHDPDRAIDSLEIERVSQDSADQRAGRAGRTRPGRAIRLWDERDRLRPHREPDIARVDLASTVLEILAWGGDPRTLGWFEAPPPAALDAAIDLLRQLNAVDAEGRLTEAGRNLRQLPLHPRLGTILLATGAVQEAARACAMLAERHFLPPRHGATSCDLLAAVDRPDILPGHVKQVARELRDRAGTILGRPPASHNDETTFRRAVLAAYPDRVARRRTPKGDRLLLASGTGAKLARESGVVNDEFLVAVDVTSMGGPPGREALIRIATGIDREWIAPTSTEIRHHLDESGAVRAAKVELYGAIPLSEQPVPVDPQQAAALIAAEYLRRGPTDGDLQLLRRLMFAGVAPSIEQLVREAAVGAVSVDAVKLLAHLPARARQALDRDAPESWRAPTGRAVRLDYRDHGGVAASIKLQELFGLADTPRLGPSRLPITFELLAPNGRPVQVTQDLKSFWARGYAEVRKELRARYPKHPWPENPTRATPTGKTTATRKPPKAAPKKKKKS